MAQEPRSVTIGLSGEWLDAVGIPADVSDIDLEELVDTVVKDNPGMFNDELQDLLYNLETERIKRILEEGRK